MKAKYRALERRVAEMERVVDRCLREHGSDLPASTIAAIRARTTRYAEGLLCLMTAEELSSTALEPTLLREQLIAEIENHTVSAIGDGLQPASAFVN